MHACKTGWVRGPVHLQLEKGFGSCCKTDNMQPSIATNPLRHAPSDEISMVPTATIYGTLDGVADEVSLSSFGRRNGRRQRSLLLGAGLVLLVGCVAIVVLASHRSDSDPVFAAQPEAEFSLPPQVCFQAMCGPALGALSMAPGDNWKVFSCLDNASSSNASLTCIRTIQDIQARTTLETCAVCMKCVKGNATALGADCSKVQDPFAPPTWRR